ncbi:cysteine-rich receptor-like protein kinase [Trifolium pratense]|uniref:Cysteine-rich receptor-like protein kinase n=1 Tax=Trifolium pratense TaxID=57577 RepID=A0A2K3LXU4_TRIPR|nr:cysteine-rich receptor-like protein kinase [Trifolium pratense]
MLVGVNIPDSWLVEAAPALCCKVGKISFLYLGLPIGGDSRRLAFWEPAQSSDRWQWQPDPDSGYTVRGAYQFLTTLDSVTLDDIEHLIWHPQGPLISEITLFSLPTQLVDLEHDGLFYSLFDLLVLGWCGRKEITVEDDECFFSL